MRNKQILLLIPLLLLMLVAVSGTFAVPAPADAIELQLKYPSIPGTDPLGNDPDDGGGRPLEVLVNEPGWLTIPNIVIFIFQAAIWLGSIMAVLSLVYVGFRFAASAGDPMQRTKAKGRLKGIIFGMLLLVGSFFLVDIINPELSSLRIFQEGVCQTEDAKEGCKNKPTLSFEDASKETVGLTLYSNVLFTGNSHIVIEDIEWTGGAFLGSPGGLEAGDGDSMKVNSLKLAQGCAIRIYKEALYSAISPGKSIVVTNNGISGHAVVYDESGIKMTPSAGGDPLWFDRNIPLEEGGGTLLLSYLNDFKLSKDGSDSWNNNVGSIKFEGSVEGGTFACDERRGLILYEDVNFDHQNKQQVFLEGNINLQSEFIGNDETSSLKIFGISEVTLYEHASGDKNEETGARLVITNTGSLATSSCQNHNRKEGTITDCITKMSMTSGVLEITNLHAIDSTNVNWGNSISRAEVVEGDNAPPSSLSKKLVLYEKDSFRGKEDIFTESRDNLDGTNVGDNSASSLKIFGVLSVIIHEHAEGDPNESTEGLLLITNTGSLSTSSCTSRNQEKSVGDPERDLDCRTKMSMNSGVLEITDLHTIESTGGGIFGPGNWGDSISRVGIRLGPAPPPPDGDTPPPNGDTPPPTTQAVIVYEHVDYNGKTDTFTSNIDIEKETTNIGHGSTGRISSLKVFPGTLAIFYENEKYNDDEGEILTIINNGEEVTCWNTFDASSDGGLCTSKLPALDADGTLSLPNFDGLIISTSFWSGNNTWNDDISSIKIVAAAISSPPVIDNIDASDITPTSAKIEWTTNKNANSQVAFCSFSTDSCGTITPLVSALETSHLINLSDLDPATTYWYWVKSADAEGNLTTGDTNHFTTLAPPPPPVDDLPKSSLDITLVTIAAKADPGLITWKASKTIAEITVKKGSTFEMSWYRTSGSISPEPYAGRCTLFKSSKDPVSGESVIEEFSIFKSPAGGLIKTATNFFVTFWIECGVGAPQSNNLEINKN